MRIAERDRSRRIEPSDLVIAQRDRDGGEVILKLLPCAVPTTGSTPLALTQATATWPGFAPTSWATALTASIAVSLLGLSACRTLALKSVAPGVGHQNPVSPWNQGLPRCPTGHVTRRYGTTPCNYVTNLAPSS